MSEAPSDPAAVEDEEVRRARAGLLVVAMVGVGLVIAFTVYVLAGGLAPQPSRSPEQRRARAAVERAELARIAGLDGESAPPAAFETVCLSVRYAGALSTVGDIVPVVVLVAVERRNGAPDEAATMNEWKFKLTASDGAVYSASARYGWRGRKCSDEIALPTNGTRACGLLFELPASTLRGRATLSWGRSMLTSGDRGVILTLPFRYSGAAEEASGK